MAYSRGALLLALLLVACEQPPSETARAPEPDVDRLEPEDVKPVPVPVPPAPPVVAAGPVPRDALRYQRLLTGNARAVWGINAPVATFAGQVHQESAWRPDAKSPFASGLAQFTPATADWISQLYPDELAGADVFNPSWALRALVRYDRWLWQRNAEAVDDCERMAFTLAGYNGGQGWVNRERVAAASKGLDSTAWFNGVERVCLRAAWACKENRDYPRRILLRHELIYQSWGLMTCN